LRLGTAAVTTAGMGEPENGEIAALIARCCVPPTTPPSDSEVHEGAARLCSKFTPLPTVFP